MSTSNAAHHGFTVCQESATRKHDGMLSTPLTTYRLWYKRGNLLAKQGNYEAALASLDTALKIQPNEHQIWLLRGIVLAHLKHYTTALASFDKAVEIACNDRQVWIFRGAVLSHLNRHGEAHNSYETALKMQQTNTRGEDYSVWLSIPSLPSKTAQFNSVSMVGSNS